MFGSWLSVRPVALTVLLPLLLCIIIAVDVLTPRGYVLAIAYVVPLWLTYWLPGTGLTMATAQQGEPIEAGHPHVREKRIEPTQFEACKGIIPPHSTLRL